MNEFLQTLLISCIPAIITGFFTYLIAHKNVLARIRVVEEQNKHDLERLMGRYKIDIDSLNKQHQQELKKIELEHKYKLELIEKRKCNNLSQNLMMGLMGEIMKRL